MMSSNNAEIDIFASPVKQDQRYVVPKDAMVLPPLATFSDCELVVNEDGKALVIFNKPLPEGIHWAEYDMDLSILTLVTWSGNIMELGLKVHAPFRKYLKMASEITLIQMSEDKQTMITLYPADLVIRNIGI